MTAQPNFMPASQTASSTTLYAQADLVNNQIDWSLDDKNPPKKNSKIKLNFGPGAGQQSISVNLIDNTGLGLQFSSDPLWVSEGGSCPPPSGVNSVQIQNVVPAGLLLTFTDMNQGDECTLIYQMNFVDRNNSLVKPLDPEIKNGGTTRANAISATTVAIAAVAVIAVVAFLLLN